MRSDIDRSSIAYRIFEFLTTEGGQAIVDESGYVPLQASSGVRALEQEAVKMEYRRSALYLSGCHIVNVWLDDDSFVQRKILL